MDSYDKYNAQQKTKQGIVRRRNWLKARIISIPHGDLDAMTKGERAMMTTIHILRDDILKSWEEGSVELGMKVKPKKEKS